MRLPLTVAILAAITCGRSPREVSLDQEFELAPGQSARVTGTTTVVRFESVRQDSRCPVDVTCIAAGNAVVVLRVQTGDASPTLELNTTLDPKRGPVDGLQLELRALDPAPRQAKTIQAKNYRVRLRFASS